MAQLKLSKNSSVYEIINTFPFNIEQALLIDSRCIARYINKSPAVIYKIINENQAKFKSLGNVLVAKTTSRDSAKSKSKGEDFFLLNKDQSSLLFSYLPNTNKSRDCKIKILKFFQASKLFQSPPYSLATIINSQFCEDQVSTVSQEFSNHLSPPLNPFNSYTIKAYARLNNIGKLDLNTAKKLGKYASSLCKKRGIVPGKTQDKTFGRINNYPLEILTETFSAFGLSSR